MLKVLFLAKADRPDYLCDMIYHGLKTTEGILVEEVNTPHYMYSYYMAQGALYGKGFTMYCHLKSYPTCIPVPEMKRRVEKKYYDFIIYGSIHRFEKYYDLITHHYSKDKVITVDGEDEGHLDLQFTQDSTYYKRELSVENALVKPITFCIPESLIVQSVPAKTKRVAHIVPGDLSTYIFDRVEDYYQDYQSSVFGITRKKGGWDCLRHYEILMNGCIPYFIDLKSCPQLTMHQLPKELLLETNEHYEKGTDFDHAQYEQELLNYTRQHLTTKKLVAYLLSR